MDSLHRLCFSFVLDWMRTTDFCAVAGPVDQTAHVVLCDLRRQTAHLPQLQPYLASRSDQHSHTKGLRRKFVCCHFVPHMRPATSRVPEVGGKAVQFVRSARFVFARLCPSDCQRNYRTETLQVGLETSNLLHLQRCFSASRTETPKHLAPTKDVGSVGNSSVLAGRSCRPKTIRGALTLRVNVPS